MARCKRVMKLGIFFTANSYFFDQNLFKTYQASSLQLGNLGVCVRVEHASFCCVTAILQSVADYHKYSLVSGEHSGTADPSPEERVEEIDPARQTGMTDNYFT